MDIIIPSYVTTKPIVVRSLHEQSKHKPFTKQTLKMVELVDCVPQSLSHLPEAPMTKDSRTNVQTTSIMFSEPDSAVERCFEWS